LSLTLLSDLSRPVPPDLVLDFQVDGCDVRPGASYIAIVVDNASVTHHHGNRADLRGLTPGYHVLRAFLVDGATGLVLKSPMAAVEAEAYVHAPAPIPAPKGFLFGSPALCHLRPRGRVPASAVASLEGAAAGGLLVDFFVSNCELSTAAHGFGVRVYVNDEPVDTLREWTAVRLTGLAAAPGDVLRVRLALVHPLGEELAFPPWSAEEQVVAVVADAEAADAKGAD
jgi:hypothetical protein